MTIESAPLKPFKMLVILFLLFSTASAATGWEQLLQNNSTQAQESFQSILKKERTGAKAGAAYIGLSEIAQYHGNQELAVQHCVQAWDAHPNPQAFIPCLYTLSLSFRSPQPHNHQQVLDIAKELMSKHPGSAITAEIWNAASQVYSYAGKPDSANQWNQKLGLLYNWNYAGPFNNVSNGGAFTNFAPEDGFDFSESYNGLSGRQVIWRAIYPQVQNWIHMDYYQNIPDAVNYFATTVTTSQEQNAFVNLGISGVFTLWINGTKVMENSVFQNTGMDIFKAPITLHKGKNHILLKLGHEQKQSNFVLRFTDKKGLAIIVPHAPEAQPAVQKGSQVAGTITNNMEASLQLALKNDPKSILWNLARLRYWLHTEQFSAAKSDALLLLQKHPQSSLLHSALAEAYMREGNKTLSDIYMEKAYRYDPANSRAWHARFSQIVQSQDVQVADSFFTNRSPLIHETAELLLSRAMMQIQLGRQAEFFALIDSLASHYSHEPIVTETLMNVFEKISSPAKTDLLLMKVNRDFPGNIHFTDLLFKWHKMRGRNDEAVQLLQTAVQNSPERTQFYSLLYSHFTALQQYQQAAQTMQDLLKVNPFMSSTYTNLGQAQIAMGDTTAAIQSFRQALQADYADHSSSNRLQEMQNKPRWNELAASFSIDSLRTLSAHFKEGKNKNSLFLLSQRSLIVYPTQSYEIIDHSVIEILDQKGIDEWKEYSIPFLSNHETTTVLHAHTVKPDGKTISADRSGRQLVFTNVQAGDLIDIKISRKYAPTGQLAQYFETMFYMGASLPRALTYFEIIAPDTTSFAIKQHKQNIEPVIQSLPNNYSKKSFFKHQVQGLSREDNMGPSDISHPWIQVSSFPNWNHISSWYNTLSRGKAIATKEVEQLADSLFAQATSASQKIKQVHLFITDKIRYSYMPFRQSGFVPQSAATTLATQVGDCKDMAVLAQTLLRHGGINSNLVLVQTRDDGGALLLPSIHFNHVILHIDSLFIDFTSPNNHMHTLPWSDQGARALLINDTQESSLFIIPLSAPATELYHGNSYDTLLTNGTLLRQVRIERGGNFSTSHRKMLKYENPEDINKTFLTGVRKRYPQATISNIQYSSAQNSDSLISYSYSVQAPNATYTGNKSIAFPLPWPGQLEGSDIPGESTREYVFQSYRNWRTWGEKKFTIQIHLPQGYTILDMPQATNISNAFGTYKTTYTIQNQTFTATRFVSLFSQDIYPDQYPEYRQFLENIAEGDKGLLILVKNH
jgi:tetratricopeptide (TPR) repeat protein